MSKARGRPPHDDQLTPTEWAVAEGVRHGLTNRQIADRRGVSLDAVKFHVGNALAKLGLENRQALRRWEGVRRDSALNGKEQAMTGEIGLGAIGQVSRSVADIMDSEAWYRDVLGLPHLFTFGDLDSVEAALRSAIADPENLAENYSNAREAIGERFSQPIVWRGSADRAPGTGPARTRSPTGPDRRSRCRCNWRRR